MHRDRRVERQSRWPEALFKRLANSSLKFCPTKFRPFRNAQSQILSIYQRQYWTSKMPSGLYIFKCLSTLLSLHCQISNIHGNTGPDQMYKLYRFESGSKDKDKKRLNSNYFFQISIPRHGHLGKPQKRFF